MGKNGTRNRGHYQVVQSGLNRLYCYPDSSKFLGHLVVSQLNKCLKFMTFREGCCVTEN